MQIAMFLSFPWPKTPLFAVFLNLLSKNTALCYVFNNMVAKNTAICEVFYIFAHRAQASAMCKSTAKTNVSAQQKRRKPSPKQLRNHKIWPPGLPTRHMEKICISKPKIEDQKSKNTCFFFFLTFLLDWRVHELVHSVL